MKIAKIITTVVLTIAATSSLAATKCNNKNNVGRFANTNPPAKFTQVAQDAKAAVKAGVR